MTRTTTNFMFAALAFAAAACSNTPKADTAMPETAATPEPEPEPAPEPKPEVKPIPEGFHSVTPQIVVKGVDAAVDFYVQTLGAQKLLAMPGPDGKTSMHAEVRIGDSIVMIDEEDPASGMKSPLSLGGSPVSLMTYVPDVDAQVAALAAAGAKVTSPVEDMFWGDRVGAVVDPFGHHWELATHVEDLTPEQVTERATIVFTPSKKKPKKGAPPAWKSVAGTPATEKVPQEYHTITPVVTVNDAAAAIEFYKQAFGATEKIRMPAADGQKIMHAELVLGDSTIMLSDAMPEMGSKAITEYGGSPVSLHYYVADVDAVFAAAQAAGAKPLMPVEDMFWGDRYGMVVDPAGMMWGVATHKEDLTPEQIGERARQYMEKAKPAS